MEGPCCPGNEFESVTIAPLLVLSPYLADDLNKFTDDTYLGLIVCHTYDLHLMNGMACRSLMYATNTKKLLMLPWT